MLKNKFYSICNKSKLFKQDLSSEIFFCGRSFDYEIILKFPPSIIEEFVNFDPYDKDALQVFLNALFESGQQIKKDLTRQDLERHIGIEAKYVYKVQLTFILHTIYYYLNDPSISYNLRMSFWSCLFEDIRECSAGFKCRAEFVLRQLMLLLESAPNLSKLISKARFDLVRETAASFQKLFVEMMQIHAFNYAFTIAHELDFGVSKLCADDPYSFHRHKDIIRQELINKFEEKFTPFNLPAIIVEQLCIWLEKCEDYKGYLEEGYTYSSLENCSEWIKAIFPCDSINNLQACDFFINSGDENFPCYTDLNLRLLKAKIFNLLIDEGYFSENKASRLSTIKKIIYLLTELNNYENLVTVAIFLNSIETIIDFINENIQYFQPEALKKLFLNKNKKNETCLTLSVVNISAALAIIDFFKNNRFIFPEKNILFLLATNNTQGNNCLMQAANDPTILGALLDLAEIYQIISHKQFCDLFLTKNKEGVTLPIMAAHQVDSFQLVLNFIESQCSFFCDGALTKALFCRSRFNNDFFLLDTLQPFTLHIFLNFVQKNAAYFYQPIFYKFFLATNKKKNNILSIAVSESESFNTTLFLIEKLWLSLKLKHLTHFFLQQNKLGNNFLHLASMQASTLVQALLFLKQHKEDFTRAQFSCLWFNKNQAKQTNLLIASHSSQLTYYLIKFTATLLEKFNQEALITWLLVRNNFNENFLFFLIDKPKIVCLTIELLINVFGKQKFQTRILRFLLFKDAKKLTGSILIDLAQKKPFAVINLLNLIFLISYELGSKFFTALLMDSSQGDSVLIVAAENFKINPELINHLYKFIISHIDYFSNEIAAFFLTKNSLGNTLLLALAAYADAKTLKKFLFILDHYITHPEVLFQIVSQKNQHEDNVLHLLMKQGFIEALKVYLKFIEKNLNRLPVKALVQIFLAKNCDSETILTLACRKKHLLNYLCSFIHRNLVLFSGKQLTSLIFTRIERKIYSGLYYHEVLIQNTTITLAAKKLDSLICLLKFIALHRSLLDENELRKFFFLEADEKISREGNIYILKFLFLHSKLFDSHIIKHWLVKNKQLLFEEMITEVLSDKTCKVKSFFNLISNNKFLLILVLNIFSKEIVNQCIKPIVFIKKMLMLYIKYLDFRGDIGQHYESLFGRIFGYSLKEKRLAACELLYCIEQPNFSKFRLGYLSTYHPALLTGKLAKFYYSLYEAAPLEQLGQYDIVTMENYLEDIRTPFFMHCLK